MFVHFILLSFRPLPVLDLLRPIASSILLGRFGTAGAFWNSDTSFFVSPDDDALQCLLDENIATCYKLSQLTACNKVGIIILWEIIYIYIYIGNVFFDIMLFQNEHLNSEPPLPQQWPRLPKGLDPTLTLSTLLLRASKLCRSHRRAPVLPSCQNTCRIQLGLEVISVGFYASPKKVGHHKLESHPAKHLRMSQRGTRYGFTIIRTRKVESTRHTWASWSNQRHCLDMGCRKSIIGNWKPITRPCFPSHLQRSPRFSRFNRCPITSYFYNNTVRRTPESDERSWMMKQMLM